MSNAAAVLDGRRERVQPSALMQGVTPRPTATLAEIYVRQGLVGRARAIYQQLASGSDDFLAGRRWTKRQAGGLALEPLAEQLG